MAKNLNEQQLADIREIFDLFDYKGDCKIPVSDIAEVTRALGYNPSNFEVGKIENCDFNCLFRLWLGRRKQLIGWILNSSCPST